MRTQKTQPQNLPVRTAILPRQKPGVRWCLLLAFAACTWGAACDVDPASPMNEGTVCQDAAAMLRACWMQVDCATYSDDALKMNCARNKMMNEQFMIDVCMPGSILYQQAEQILSCARLNPAKECACEVR